MSNITEEIKSRLDLVDIIKDYIKLIPAGVNFKARCPFHNEKTPSFFVSTEKQIWHCFGCGAGGDIFEFVKKIEGLEFPEVLRILAEKAHVKIDYHYNPELKNQKTKVLDILDASANYFHQLLLNNANAQIARDYLIQRKINNQAIQEFNLGYSKDSWNDLLNYLRDQKFSLLDIESAGLILRSKKDDKFYDRFRGRLMFPINNIFGQVIGFTARVLKEDAQQGKYINSPQSIVFDKSSVLYNMDLAKLSIKQKNYAILAEGQIDVISSYMSGVKNIIASSGTALTIQQVKIIKRYSENLMIAYDADKAGLKATFRIIDNALLENMNVKIIEIPDGLDPDQLIKKDPQLWLEAIKNARPIMDFVFDKVLSSGDINNVFHKKNMVKKLLVFISKFKDDIERQVYLKRLSDSLDIDFELLQEKMNVFLSKKKKGYFNKETNQDEYSPSKLNKREELLKKIIALAINSLSDLDYLMSNLELEYINSTIIDNLYKDLIIYYTKHNSFDLNDFQNSLDKEKKDLLDMTLLIFDNEQSNRKNDEIIAEDIKSLVLLYKKEFLNQESESRQILINQAQRNGDLELENKYFQELNEINLKKKNLNI